MPPSVRTPFRSGPKTTGYGRPCAGLTGVLCAPARQVWESVSARRGLSSGREHVSDAMAHCTLESRSLGRPVCYVLFVPRWSRAVMEAVCVLGGRSRGLGTVR